MSTQIFLRIVLRITAWLAGGLLLLLIFLLLLFRTAAFQQFVKALAVNWFNEQGAARLHIDRFAATYGGRLELDGFFLQDAAGDTLLYSRQLALEVSWWQLPKTLKIESVHWSGLVGRVQQLPDSNFNFSFLTELFGSSEAPADTDDGGSMAFDIGPVLLQQFDLQLDASAWSVQSKLRFDTLLVEPKSIDLNQQNFAIQRILLHGLQLVWQGDLPATEAPVDSTPSAMPVLRLDALAIRESSFDLALAAFRSNLVLGDFGLALPLLDLNRSLVQLDSLHLFNSTASLVSTAKPAQAADASSQAVAPAPFVWPVADVKLRGIHLHNNRVQLAEGDEAVADWHLQDLQLGLRYADSAVGLQWQLAGLTEPGGFRLGQFDGRLQANDRKMDLTAVNTAFGRSDVQLEASVRYPQLQALLALDSTAVFEGELLSRQLFPADLNALLPGMDSLSDWRRLSAQPLAFALALDGTTERLQLDTLQLDWAAGSRLTLSGRAERWLDAEQRTFKLTPLHWSSIGSDMQLLYPDTAVQWPARLDLHGGVFYSEQRLSTGLRLELPEGDAQLLAAYQAGDSQRVVTDLFLSGKSWGRLLRQPLLGDIQLNVHFEGSGTDLASARAQLEGEVYTLEYRGERFDFLKFSGDLAQQQLAFQADLNHEALSFDLALAARLDSLQPVADMRLRLLRANLKRLGIREEELMARLNLEAHYEAQGDEMQAHLRLREALLSDPKTRIPIDSLTATFASGAGGSKAELQSDFAEGKWQANAPIAAVLAALQAQLEAMMKPDSAAVPRADSNAVQLAGHFHWRDDRNLAGLLVPGLESFDSAAVQLYFDERAKRLGLVFSVPKVVFEGVDLQGLELQADGRADSLRFSFGFDRLRQGEMVDLHATSLSGSWHDRDLLARFEVKDAALKSIYKLEAGVQHSGDTSVLRFSPEILLQSVAWRLPESHYVRWANRFVEAEGMDLRRAEQAVRLVQTAPHDLLLQFEGFELGNLTALLQADSNWLAGRLEGGIGLEDIFNTQALQANLRIDALRFADQDLGRLRLNAERGQGQRFDFGLHLNGGVVSMQLLGDYLAREGSAALRLDLQVDTLPMQLLAALAPEQFDEAAGYVRVGLKIGGTLASPAYAGDLRFQQAALRIRSLNSRFQLANERVALDQDGIYFQQFVMLDEKGAPMRLSGQIDTRTWLRPHLRLELEAQQFQLINSTASDNPLFYGQASVSTRAKVGGSFNAPEVSLTARLNKGSKLWMVVPASQAELVERDGVLLFVNMADTAGRSEQLPERLSEITGVELDALFEIDPQTEFTVVVDERSGDQLLVGGQAKLRFQLSPNGQMRLSGVYELSRGHYELSMYELVQRKFELQPGSTISWQGDPLDANLNLRAIYRVKTDAVDLMSEQLSGADASTRSKYRQELPFEVYTDLTGALLKPEVRFALDMPEQQRGALGGQVYSRVQQLNQQESELNKQVFSLLVFNSFLPAGNQSSEPSTAAMARNSASQLLSSQLNSLSAKYIKGVDLDLNLNSFTDYQSGDANERTVANVQLRKELLNDRLVIQVGSQVDLEGQQRRQQSASDLLGDVSAEYMLTADGAYRLKAFRRNQFEGVIEGQLIITGASLVYNREFNSFHEAFKRKQQRPKPEQPSESSPNANSNEEVQP